MLLTTTLRPLAWHPFFPAALRKIAGLRPAAAVPLGRGPSEGPARRRSSSEAGSGSEQVRLRFDTSAGLGTKVSPSGSPDALFQEAMEAVRLRRAELDVDPTYHGRDTKDVARLKQDELELTRKVFQRIDPTRDLTSDFTVGGHDIDPYWNPFHKVDRLQKQVTAEFDEYARYVSVAEARRARIQIRKAIKRSQKAYNPYSEEFRKWHGRESGFDQLPKPFRIPDKYWERSPLQAKLEMEKITFRDVDIIQHFLADNGYILPRRTTMLSRLQQARLVKAVRTAQKMSLIPYTWRTPDYQAMPLMDPLQWMADRLTDRVITDGNLRARAMLQIMVERYPELNFRNFLAHEAAQKEKDASPA